MTGAPGRPGVIGDPGVTGEDGGTIGTGGANLPALGWDDAWTTAWEAATPTQRVLTLGTFLDRSCRCLLGHAHGP